MISIEMYRFRIGNFGGGRHFRRKRQEGSDVRATWADLVVILLYTWGTFVLQSSFECASDTSREAFSCAGGPRGSFRIGSHRWDNLEGWNSTTTTTGYEIVSTLHSIDGTTHWKTRGFLQHHSLDTTHKDLKEVSDVFDLLHAPLRDKFVCWAEVVPGQTGSGECGGQLFLTVQFYLVFCSN